MQINLEDNPLPSSLIVYYKDKNNNFISCTSSFSEMVGLQKSSNIKNIKKDIIPENCNLDFFLYKDIEVIETGKLFMEENGNFLTVKIPLLNNNEILGLLNISSNVSETKKFKDLEQENLILDQIIASVPGHLYWRDTNCVLQGCNEEQAKNVNLKSRKDIIGMTAYDLLSDSQGEEKRKETADMVNMIDKKIMDEKLPKQFEEVVMLAGENFERTFLSYKTPLLNKEGDIVGLVGISLDITNLKKAQLEAEMANQAKSYTLGLITEELYTPYEKILELVSKLHLYRNTVERQETTALMVEHAEEGKEMLKMLVENAKLTSVDPRLMGYDNFDLKILLEESVNANNNWATERHIDLVVSYPDDVPVWVSDYKISLRRIINYLINIVIAESERARISIKATLVKKEYKNMDIEISIVPEGELLNIKRTLLDTSQKTELNKLQEKRKYLGLENIKKAVDLIKSELKIIDNNGEGLSVYLKMNFPIDTVLPSSQSPWKTYQSQTRILIIDSEGRGDIIRQYLGEDNIDLISSHNDLERKFHAADMAEKSYHIAIIGRVGKGELQSSRAAKIARDIRKLRIKEKPMIVLLIDKQASDIPYAREFDTLIQASLLPSELQKELTVAWESYLDKNQNKSE